MKFLFDFFPTLVFFLVYKLFGIFPATYAIITASLLQIAVFWFKNKTIEPMHLILLIMILIFGGLTLYFHNVKFLMWKVSLVNWLIGSAMLISQLFNKNILSYFFDFAHATQSKTAEKIIIPPFVLNRLNFAWGSFFLALGCLNLYIAFHFSLNVWVEFKVFGIIGLSLVFAIIQSFYLYRYLKDPL